MKFEDFEAGKELEERKKKMEMVRIDTEEKNMEYLKGGSQENELKSNISFKEYPENFDDKRISDIVNFSVLQENLGNCLQIIEDEVMKGYITQLGNLPVVDPDKIISFSNDIYFFKITELVYQENEFSVHKLSMIFHSLSNKPCTLALMIKSDGKKNDFYMGVRSLDSRYSSGTMRDTLQKALLGLFPGSKIKRYLEEDRKEDMSQLKVNCISSVTCVADYKQDRENMSNQNFIQGLEKFVNSMQKETYTAIFIADNVSYSDLMKIRSEYEQIYTQLSPFANMQFNFAVNAANSKSNSQSEGKTQTVTHGYSESKTANISNGHTVTTGTSEMYGSSTAYGTNETTSDGVSKTKGYSSGETYTETDSDTKSFSMGGNVGVRMGLGIGLGINGGKALTHSVSKGIQNTDSVSDSVSKTLAHGISQTDTKSRNVGTSKSNSDSVTYSRGSQEGTNESVGASFNLVNSETLTDTFGTSQGITLNAKNMTLLSILERLEKHLKRIDECESLGMWNFAAYFLGEGAADTETAANTYQSIVSGMQSGIERAAVNTWSEGEKLKSVAAYIKNFMHPYFLYQGFSYEGEQNVIVNPSALVSTNELAIHMGLPRYSVKGLPVTEHAVFAQEVLNRKENVEKKLSMGKVYHLGEETGTKIALDQESLTMHTFITGSTGAGKSNTVYHLLSEVSKQKIPFLVIEPAKGEYRKVFPKARYYGTNPNLGEILQINPFSFPSQIHVLEHIDRLVEIFNVCWPMYAAMPAVLKESIEKSYESAGWDLDLSVNTKMEQLFPTFDDVLRELHFVIDHSAYSSDTKGDYIGSLSTRIKSLTNGINGRIFVSSEMNLQTIFDEDAILDISRIGSIETKSLIMGLVVLKLQEYRMSYETGMNAELKHITVLEEAHHLLKKTSTEQSQDSANLAGKSVEMLTNLIAEIRTFGEGFVIVDQAPDLLDTAAIRNTNTKIVLRLPEGNDRKIIGTSMALKENQIAELSKLPTGVAAFYQNDWQEAILCKVSEYKDIKVEQQTEERKNLLSDRTAKKKEKDDVLHMLLKDNDAEEVLLWKEKILKLNLSAKIRMDLICHFQSRDLFYEWAVADFIQKSYKVDHVFYGTQDGQWETLEQLSQIMLMNIEREFEDFSRLEQLKILYYICRIQHEMHPQNQIIEKLRIDYLKKEIQNG